MATTSILLISVLVAILILMVLLIIYTICLFWAFRGGIDLPLNEDSEASYGKPVRIILKNPFKKERAIVKPYTKYTSGIIDNDIADVDSEEINPKLREMFQNVDSSPTKTF